MATATATRPPVNVRRDFKIFTKALKAYTIVVKDAEGNEQTEHYLEAPASSTVVDRMGDVMAMSAQKKMEAAVKDMTIWLNHDYEVPESIFGTCEKSEIVAANDPVQGSCFDLIIRVRCYVQNDRVMKTWNAVAAGIKLGFSIGGFIPNDGYEFKETPGGDFIFIINDIDLYEVSVVGIPAQQRAVIDDVVKGLRKRFLQEREQNGSIVRRKENEGKTEEQLAAELDAKAKADAQAAADAETATHEAPAPGAGTEADRPGTGAPQAATPPATPEGEKAEPVEVTFSFSNGGATIDASKYIALVTEMLKAEKIGAEVVTATKAIPVAAQKTIRGAMDNLHKAVAHGVCSDANESVGAAHEALKTLLPESGDSNDTDGADDMRAALAIVEAHDQLQKVLQERDQAQATLDSIKAESDTAAAALEQKRAELAELDAKIATAKATPLPRQTAKYVDGESESPSGERTADPERRSEPEANVLARLARKLRREAPEETSVDARTLSTRT